MSQEMTQQSCFNFHVIYYSAINVASNLLMLSFDHLIELLLSTIIHMNHYSHCSFHVISASVLFTIHLQ